MWFTGGLILGFVVTLTIALHQPDYPCTTISTTLVRRIDMTITTIPGGSGRGPYDKTPMRLECREIRWKLDSPPGAVLEPLPK